MFNKTTSYIFQRYGEIISDTSKNSISNLHTKSIEIKEKSIDHFYVSNHDTYIKVTEGIVMLVVSCNQEESYERFVIHRTIKIRSDIKFNFLAISSFAKIELSCDFDTAITNVPVYQNQPIVYEPLIPSFQIKEIYGCYYQVRNHNYSFPGEKHNFWELTFIDNGELSTKVDDTEYQLQRMDIILYAPNQYHTQWNQSHHSCSYLTVLFDMDLPNPELITNRIYHAHRELHNALNNFIKASDNHILYDQELMLCYLKELMIRLMQYDILETSPIASSPMQQKFENELLNEIIIYINEHIYEQLPIEDICMKFSISRSSLQALFKNNLNVAPKQYISNLKLAKSKLLIKESVYTISEISAMLGFTSIHYFSRKFKQKFHITPSDYAKTIYD